METRQRELGITLEDLMVEPTSVQVGLTMSPTHTGEVTKYKIQGAK